MVQGMVTKPIFLITLLAAALACFSATVEASDRSRSPSSYMNEGGGIGSDPELDKKIAESDQILALDESGAGMEEGPFPLEINNRVASWIHHFSHRDRERTIRYFQRGSAYINQLEKMLEQNDVPKEIFFLAMIESGFVQHATSHAEAVGIWQLIPGTAKNYGLKVNRYVDERRNWIKSTEAAVTYLKDLKNVFGSWYLAFAAYNAGEYRIVRSIMDGKTRDFWTLAEGNMLPVETLNYVPKFMAAMIIGKDPEKYGITFTKAEEWGEFEVIEAPSGVALKDLARASGVSLEMIREWNPDILRDRVPYDKTGKFTMYLPIEQAKIFASKKDAIASLKRSSFGDLAQHDSNRDFAIYVVKPGDTLSSISRTTGLSARALKRLNRLSRDRLHPGQRIRYLNAVAAESEKFRVHVVKINETIHSIARRHKVTAEQIMAANNMRSIDVLPGQKLRIPMNIAMQGEIRKPGSASGGYHVVKRGETLSKIASRYGTSVKALRRANNLKKNGLRTGQELRIQ